ncbi:hybrid sensor histidine kinase/response regulator [Allocoleopsis sp.]|uniref:hybrid sensor histidine kinase/response regulator n=1 Tax=Allocoleopsis sp. TaxID=3088169 RepID=UPI002FD42D7C
MNLLEFAPKIEEWLLRVAHLLQNTDSASAATSGASQLPEQQNLLIEASQELQIAMEELHVAQTELLQQNQELMVIREAVEAERLRYQELFEFAPDGYLVTDVNGTIQEANRAAAMMLNIESRFLVGKPLSVFITQPERQRFYALLIQLGHIDRIQEWEVRLEPRKGTPLDAALSVTAVRDKEGKRIALRWLLHDITDRKRAEEQRRLLAYEQAAREAAEAHGKRSTFLAEASRVLASSLDYQTTLARVAQLAVPTLADWCFIDLIENNLAGCGEPVVATSEPVNEALLRQLRRRYPLPFNADAETARVLQTGEPELVTDIPDSFLLSVARDEEHLSLLRQFNAKSYMVVPLTARKRKLGTMTFVSSQPECRYSRVDLMIAVELAQRCAIAIDNARLYQEAQEANRIKDEFLAIVSHELRTPLNAILGWVNILRNRKVNESLTTRALETIERNAKSQTKLIEDILDISRIIRGSIRLNTHPVHIASLIHAVIENVRPTAELKAIQIESSFDPSVSLVMGDQERLQQIVWNLLSNAVKFTPEGGCVEVRLEQVNSTAQIAVKDTGKGINPAFLPLVFDRFRQADSTTTRTHGGLGLGLAIVRQLVEMHNGMVYAASEGEGKGATFIVQLPVIEAVQEEATEENASGDKAPTLEGLRVLVVDDSADTLDLIAFILEQYKAQVTTATSVDEALHAIAQVKPDVIISDIGMPEQDGYSLIRQVRTLEGDGGKQIPAVALTAFAGEEDRTLILNSGFQMHIPKPVEPTELVAIVANMMGRDPTIDWN